MKKIINKIKHILKLIIYYSFIYNIPHSRFCPLFNTVRKFYICNVLKIAFPCRYSKFQNKVYIANFSNIFIGKECQINEHTFIQGARIGDYVMIAPHVTILSSMHGYDQISVPMIKQEKKKNIIPIIGNDVWIGTRAVIMPGVRVGDGCIIGAGAVVTRSTEPYGIYAGVPARKIRSRCDSPFEHPKIQALFKVIP